MSNHGVYIQQKPTSISTPRVAAVGIPFVIGCAPVHTAEKPAAGGKPTLCTSWAEAVSKLGYSEDWGKYGLCEFMYSHFRLFACQPVIFCNLLDPETMQTAVTAADINVVDNKARLPLETINDDGLIVKKTGEEGETLILDEDYTVYYDGDCCVVEILEGGTIYGAEKISIAYRAIDTEQVTSATVAGGLEAIELCLTTIGIVPDLICAPGYSQDSVVAAVMAAKAAGINGKFVAKALIDIEADSYDEVYTAKGKANLVDENQILCWPKLGLGDMRFHFSTQLAGLIATVDGKNNGCPYESPSNKSLKCDCAVNGDGEEISLTLTQANIINGHGVVTALNFMGGWVAWGNNTACYPTNTDVKDYYIPISRMFDWVGSTLVNTFWSYIDRPMTRRLADSIIDSTNIWLNGLFGAGYLLGARVEMLEEENPQTDLMAGIIRVHIYITPPGPAEEITFILEYDPAYVTAAFS